MDRYRGLVWSLARRVLGAGTDVEDAVQEVFIDLWKSAGRFQPQVASEATFVATIARRRLIDHRRRRTRQADVQAAVPVEEIDVPDDHEEGGGMEVAEEAARAVAAIRELRPDQQAVLKLSVYEGWSHQRIAEELKMPLGTVKTHARRGLQRVREMLGRPQPPTGRNETG